MGLCEEIEWLEKLGKADEMYQRATELTTMKMNKLRRQRYQISKEI